MYFIPMFVCIHRLYSISYFSGSFKSELQAVISACRRTRSYVEHVCSNLINEAVTVMDVSNPSNSYHALIYMVPKFYISDECYSCSY